MSPRTLLTTLESLPRKERCQVIGHLLRLKVAEEDPQRPQRAAAMLNDPQQWVGGRKPFASCSKADAREEEPSVPSPK